MITRRDSMELLGLGAATAALPRFAFADAPTFPKGAVIRTLLKDYAPQDLAGGATLFHEHMSLRDGFMTDWMRHAAETRAANAPPGSPPRPGGQGGVVPPAPNALADEDLLADE